MTNTIGPIIRLQVQRTRLKTGQKPTARYSLKHIEAVDALNLTPNGAVALREDREIVDIHNLTHPYNRSQDRRRTVSVGFTSHYERMISRFGSHLTVGSAGETIIVKALRTYALDELARGLIILSDSGEERCRLSDVSVIHPCREFSLFALGREDVGAATLKETLQFLDGGTRGFCCAVAAADPARDNNKRGIRVVLGDLLAAVS